MRCGVLVLVALMATGCAALSLQGRVTRFHELDAAPKTYFVVPPNEGGSLEFRSYASLVAAKLNSLGWREASFDGAEVAVVLQYQISQGREVAFSYPIFGPVKSGTSTTTGTINTYGNQSTINATTTQNTTVGVVGAGTGSNTVFDRAVRITMFSLPVYRDTQKMTSLYEGEIRSTGSTGDLPTIMPALVSGLLQQFPGKSGTANDVSVPLKE
jgi:hypothetical protein